MEIAIFGSLVGGLVAVGAALLGASFGAAVGVYFLVGVTVTGLLAYLKCKGDL